MSENQSEQSNTSATAVASGELLSGGWYCVVSPEGIIVHTTISLTECEAIRLWIEQEQAMNVLVNAGRSMRGESPRCSPSWEQFQAEGYKVLPVKVEVLNANNT